jgi:glycine/D-amino acid oxidase-like deaminating enzyme
MKISVVGAGIMGLGAAWALERLGHQVTIFEQGALPNPLGSSHDSHRAIRYAYGAEAGYMRMVADAYAIWQRLWVDLGETLYVPTGSLCVASASTAWNRRSAEALAAAGHGVDWLTPADLARRFPLLDADGIGEAFFLDSGGVLLADQILGALTRRLATRGVELRAHTAVAGVDPDRGWVTLSDGSVVGADAVVVAAGPWVARLLPEFRHRVTPSRQVVAYMTPPAHLAEAWRKSPLLLDLDADTGFYVIPPVAGTGLKFGDHRFSRSGDPDGDRLASEAEISDLLIGCGKRLRHWDQYRVERVKACFYTVEPREKFIVEPLGVAGWVMSPCSGHGFKFGPLLGSAVAGAIDSGEVGDIAAWAAGEHG